LKLKSQILLVQNGIPVYRDKSLQQGYVIPDSEIAFLDRMTTVVTHSSAKFLTENAVQESDYKIGSARGRNRSMRYATIHYVHPA